MNTREAAVRLGMPVRELYRLIDRGQLRAHSVGRDLRIRAEEIETFGGTQPRP